MAARRRVRGVFLLAVLPSFLVAVLLSRRTTATTDAPTPSPSAAPTGFPSMAPSSSPTVFENPLPHGGHRLHDRVDHAELSLKVIYSQLQGPGEHLLNGIFLGDMIALQTFKTQFVIDIHNAVNVSTDRIVVADVAPGSVDFYWEVENVIVTFFLFAQYKSYANAEDDEAFDEHQFDRPSNAAIRDLTLQAQDPNSLLHQGLVTGATDPLYGITVRYWDVSLRLTYNIEVIGEDLVEKKAPLGEDVLFLNQGSERFCEIGGNSTDTAYCIFEDFFTHDIADALAISEPRVDVLFIKEASLDSVLIHFRIVPYELVYPSRYNTDPDDAVDFAEPTVREAVQNLTQQVQDLTSPLYMGNVTVRVDSTWGVGHSNASSTARVTSPYIPYSYQNTSDDSYERCKATHRCNRAYRSYNQSDASSYFTQRHHEGGEHNAVDLFADFEDWRAGTNGWGVRGTTTVDTSVPRSLWRPRGAHFSPFNFSALGPSVPTFQDVGFLRDAPSRADTVRNNGLVLNKDVQTQQVVDQQALVDRLRTDRDWSIENREIAIMDSTLRSRWDVRDVMLGRIADLNDTLNFEQDKLDTLKNSQCTNQQCTLLFNTSSLTCTGAINVTGTVAYTESGTEVALFTFDSIELGPGVNVTLAGQRALCISSRSSILLNTTLRAVPGTIGGFPGGYSVARKPDDVLSDFPADVFLRDLEDADVPVSNCVNGPGSGCVRVQLLTVTTSAEDVDEVQTITTTATAGQTLGGGFKLHFKDYSSQLIPHDAPASLVKRIIETDLNANFPVAVEQSRRIDEAPGIGLVDVTRSRQDDHEGYTWTITFVSAIGNVPELRATNLLSSMGAHVQPFTVTEGNTIGGEFTLSYLGATTEKMAFDISADDMAERLQGDLPNVLTAFVERSDPTNLCGDGLCENGPLPAGGYIWSAILTTSTDNVRPTSPTSPVAQTSGPVSSVTAQSHLTGTNAIVTIREGHAHSRNQQMARLNATYPFTLSYGGAGAGYGGAGGLGYGANTGGQPYGDEILTDSLGGSGGAMGEVQPHIINAFERPTGRGGHGGGAIELVAHNDVTIGSHGAVIANGKGGGWGSINGGGGGSGGSIKISAGGVVHHEGVLSSIGGDGGASGIGGKLARNGGGGGGGRIAIFGSSVNAHGSTNVAGGASGLCAASRDDFVESTDGVWQGLSYKVAEGERCAIKRPGTEGSFYSWQPFGLDVSIDSSTGAENTRRSLKLVSNETTATASGATKRTPFVYNGPEHLIDGGDAQPGRVTFYVKIAAPPSEAAKANWGAAFVLHSADDEDGESEFVDMGIIGVAVGRTFTHGANFYLGPGDDKYLQRLIDFHPSTHMDTWYKVDIIIDWQAHQYDIRLDDVILVRRAPFEGERVRRIGMYSYHAGTAWFDEVFAGEDNTMGFRCPEVTSRGVKMDRPMQTGWSLEALGGDSYNLRMQRHESHLYERPYYDFDEDGDPTIGRNFEGDGMQRYLSDLKFKFADGDHRIREGELHAGALLYRPGRTATRSMAEAASTSATLAAGGDFWTSGETSGVSGKSGTYYWYGEHNGGGGGEGSVCACSSNDLITWKFEGAMLHFPNLTDMVHQQAAMGAGEGEGEGEVDGATLLVERPKVLYNAKTGKYVMWMTVDNHNRSLGLAGVAISDYATGPFEFLRTFYPDGNRTHDQTVMLTPDGTSAFLGRTYYLDVNYILPNPVMQPLWESVKKTGGEVDFGLSYHRTFYEPAYDDYHDTYLQRWRLEDRPWEVACVNKITGESRTVGRGQENFTSLTWPFNGVDGEACIDPIEYKVILGQGSPSIISRFKDPNDPANSVWQPSSVPAVKSQTWADNYVDGSCGIRKLDGGLERDDPDIPEYKQEMPPNRGNCSNIADNPLHSSGVDRLVGVDNVVLTRRAKYVAISRLTDDYLDTSGVLNSFEGEMENEDDLIQLMAQFQQFNWDAGSEMRSTFVDGQYSHNADGERLFKMSPDWDTRYHQFSENPNDRAFYTLGCVHDGDCPVDFASQIEDWGYSPMLGEQPLDRNVH